MATQNPTPQKQTSIASSIFEAESNKAEKVTVKEFAAMMAKGKLILTDELLKTVTRFEDSEFQIAAHATVRMLDDKIVTYFPTTEAVSIAINDAINGGYGLNLVWKKEKDERTDEEKYTGAFTLEKLDIKGTWKKTEKKVRGVLFLYNFRQENL